MNRYIIPRTIIVLFVLAIIVSMCVSVQDQQRQALPTAGVCSVSSGGSIQSALNNTACMTVSVSPGDYRWGGFYRWTRSNTTLVCPSFGCRIGAVIFEGNYNTIRGFEISSDDFKTGIRTYGNYNLIEQNEIHDVLEDAIWLWGTGNIVRGNYFHDIWALGSNTPGEEPFDNHIDGIMTDNTFSPSSIVKTAEDLMIDGNVIVLDRNHGSNAFFMLNAGGGKPVLPKNITWQNNTLICNDPDFCPIALFGDSTTTGMRILNNIFYNTTNRGESLVWMQNGAAGCVISGNVSYGNGAVERPGNYCTKTNNQLLVFISLPSWYTSGAFWPPQTSTPVPPTATQPISTIISSLTNSPTVTKTATVPPSPTKTPTATATKTLVPPTYTATSTITPTGTFTQVPATKTFTPIPPSVTNTPVIFTPTNTQIPLTLVPPTSTFTSTPKPPTATPVPTLPPAYVCKWLGWVRFFEWLRCISGRG